MTAHACHLCVRSSHQAIPYASALVSAVASAASCFFFIGDRSKNSFVKNPTELGGARRLWALTCKHLMVSAATPAFPYTSAGKKVRHSCRSVNCCWNASWIPSALHTKLPLLLVCERRCGRRCSPSVLQMTKTCNSLLCTANGSPSMRGGVPSRLRKPAVYKYQATVCPILRGHWRVEILDLDPLSQPKVLGAILLRVEVYDASLVGLGI